MITRLYIDNYKCFSNFTYEPQSLDLLIGKNGSGKTSIFDVLLDLKKIAVEGERVENVFDASSLTAWDQRDLQTFELSLKDGEDEFTYRLQIQHDRDANRSQIVKESVVVNKEQIYRFDENGVQLRRASSSKSVSGSVSLSITGSETHSQSAGENITYPQENQRSPLASLPGREVPKKLIHFRNQLERILVLSPNPVSMDGIASREISQPSHNMSDLASWIRHLSQESFQAYSRLQELLKDGVLEGFRNLYLPKVTSTSRSLMLDFSFASNGSGKPFTLSFDQISTGQRMLVALYTIACVLEDQDFIICIDEPENFISLREIQPWLRMIEDLVHEKGRQCLMISHHPEMLNHLANEHGTLLYREESGVVRSKKFECDKELLTPGEIVARGWQ